MSDKLTLDARGLLCPLPVLKARKALKAMNAGDLLEIQATDPGAPKDLADFCKTAGYNLREQREEDGVFFLTVEKPLS